MRSQVKSIINVPEKENDILASISKVKVSVFSPEQEFGAGNSDKFFIDALLSNRLWSIGKQKVFIDKF